jgi:hypothetical protein
LSLSNKVEVLVLDDLLDGWLVFMDLAAFTDGFSFVGIETDKNITMLTSCPSQ